MISKVPVSQHLLILLFVTYLKIKFNLVSYSLFAKSDSPCLDFDLGTVLNHSRSSTRKKCSFGDSKTQRRNFILVKACGWPTSLVISILILLYLQSWKLSSLGIELKNGGHVFHCCYWEVSSVCGPFFLISYTLSLVLEFLYDVY
jgi:hypothetical protein